MPNIQSAKKKLRKDHKKTARNDKHEKNIKRSLKDLTKNAGKNSVEDLKKAHSIIDKAAKKNVIHKNKAARLKSRVSRLVKNK